MQGNPALTWSMRQSAIGSMSCISPPAPTHWLGKLLIQVLQFHPHNPAQNNGGDVRIARIEIAFTGRRPHLATQRACVLVLRRIGGDPIRQLDVFAVNNACQVARGVAEAA
jgi:hypothetical protein